jgi:hypothetical protein
MMTHTAARAPVQLSLSHKIIWGITALGTLLISDTYRALLPI